jgi:hypothetical protein
LAEPVPEMLTVGRLSTLRRFPRITDPNGLASFKADLIVRPAVTSLNPESEAETAIQRPESAEAFAGEIPKYLVRPGLFPAKYAVPCVRMIEILSRPIATVCLAVLRDESSTSTPVVFPEKKWTVIRTDPSPVAEASAVLRTWLGDSPGLREVSAEAEETNAALVKRTTAPTPAMATFIRRLFTNTTICWATVASRSSAFEDETGHGPEPTAETRFGVGFS